MDKFKTLAANLQKLGPKDREFAISLLDQHHRKGHLSDKQLHWIGVLADRSVQSEVKAATSSRFPKLVELITSAAEDIQFPKIVVNLGDGKGRVKVYRSGPRSRFHGHLAVVHADRDVFYGRIDLEGVFHQHRNCTAEVLDLLEWLEKDRATVSRLSAANDRAAGHARGCCMFCARELTDERSVVKSYGPICAGRYGLPWGDVPEKDEPAEEEHATERGCDKCGSALHRVREDLDGQPSFCDLCYFDERDYIAQQYYG